MTAKQLPFALQHHEGSDFYYSLLFTAKNKKEDLITIHEFYQAISLIPSTVKDKTVAEKKLAWWQQEIDLLFNHDFPSHPITQKLIDPVSKYKLPKQLFAGIITGIQNTIEFPIINTYEELILSCHHTVSLREMLITYCLVEPTTAALGFARDLGVTLRLTEIIQNLRNDIKRGYLFLPLEELEKFSIKPDDLLQLKPDLNLTPLLNDLAEKIIVNSQQTLEKLEPQNKAKQISQLISNAIALKLLGKMKKEDFNVLQKQYNLLPISKLFIAWKTYIKTY